MSRYYSTDDLDSLWQGILNIDHLDWETNKECSIIEHLQDINKVSEDMLRETYFGMRYSDATIKNEVPDDLLDVKAILSRANQMPEFTSLRNTTGGDETAALIAVGAFFNDLYENLPAEVKDELKNAANSKEEKRKLSQYLQDLQNLYSEYDQNPPSAYGSEQQASNGAKADSPSDSACRMDREKLDSECKKTENHLKQAEENYQQAIDSLETALNHKSGTISYSVASSSKSVKQQLEKLKNLKDSLSWGDENNVSPIQMGEIDSLLELSKYLEENGFEKLIDMLGKCEKMAESLLESNLHGREELVEYKVAPFDLEGLAPNELLALADDPEGPMMYDLLSRLDSTLHTNFEGTEPTAKGPIVFVEDVSGSTKGTAFSLLSAINFTLIKSSAIQNRDFVNIPFSGLDQFDVYRPGKNPDLKKILSHLNSGYFGGTEPYKPLLKAIEIIENDPSMKKASILFATDGAIPAPTHEFLEKLADLRLKRTLDLYALLIGTNQSSVSFATKVICLRQPYLVNKDIFGILEPLL